MSPSYLVKRLALIVYTLFVVSLVVFGITQVLPADAAVMLLGENATPDALAAMRDKLGLDQPVWRAVRPLAVAACCRATSAPRCAPASRSRPVMLEALGRSLLLALLAIALMLVLALPLGIVGGAAARQARRSRGQHRRPMSACRCPSSSPRRLIVLVLADWLQLLPATGYVPLTEDFWRRPRRTSCCRC